MASHPNITALLLDPIVTLIIIHQNIFSILPIFCPQIYICGHLGGVIIQSVLHNIQN